MIHLDILDLENVALQYGFRVLSYNVKLTENGQPAEVQYVLNFNERTREGLYEFADSLNLGILIQKFPSNRAEMAVMESILNTGYDMSGKFVPLHNRKQSNFEKYRVTISIIIDEMKFNNFSILDGSVLSAEEFMKGLKQAIKNLMRVPTLLSSAHHMFDENPGLIEPNKPMKLKSSLIDKDK